MRSAAEAVAYAKALHALVRWIDICDGNMQEGSFRCDANVSVRPRGTEKLGTRCEIKNLNSFRFLERAIEFEVRRQIELLEDGGKVVQETRLYDSERDETRSMRSKEDAQDYRYFPDPDLLPLEVTPAWIERVRKALPELPVAKRERLQSELGLPAYDATVLTASREMAAYFEDVVRVLPGHAKLIANWVMGELAGRLNKEGREIQHSPISAPSLAGLLGRIADGTLSGKMAKDVFDALWDGAMDADQIIQERGLKQISDTGEIEKIVDAIVAANPAQVAEYRAGKEKAFNFFVGQVMKASKGKANPNQVNETLRRKLSV
jgi:aspartyl-tRNA(Asn)/glutamyl-tRNA(Gln) amidotransferase subunit B